MPIPKEKVNYMPEKPSNVSTAAREVELAVGRLDSLSTLPCVAVRFLPKLLQEPFSGTELTDIIESDPALTARILSLIYREDVRLAGGVFSLGPALDKLPAHIVRDAILSIKISQDLNFDDEPEGQRTLSRKELLLHSIAAAHCAKGIAESSDVQVNSKMAYFAGLLHDIGKLALADAMPKSFTRIIEEAESTKQCSRIIEQQHLGADHTILGKRLAQKWRLPNAIVLAIWLHHSDTAAISESMPEAKIAQVVQLADSVARQSGIGQSGSYDLPGRTEVISRSLGIGPEQLQQILQNLPEAVGKTSEVLGLDLSNAPASYCDAAQAATVQLARRQAELSAENRRLQTASSHLDFTTDFLLSIDSTAEAIDVAENFAARWQKFYQTGTVCLYLARSAGLRKLDAVVVESLAQSRTVCLDVPGKISAIPKPIANSFAILDAHDHIEWLFEQLDVDFGAGRTKLVPLLSGGRAVGAIAFELFYPGDAELFEEKFRTSASIAGAVLDMAFARQRQRHFAERFAQLIHSPQTGASALGDTVLESVDIPPTKPEDIPPETAADVSIEALAEMAAGAAHELNNPLAVVCGRAQLLAQIESDQEKKEILNQIHQNANEASAIIKDLMSFAEPPGPRAAQTDVRQMLDEAIQLTSVKTNAEHINVQIEVADDAGNVFVDSAQIASAIANVVANAVESYSDELGPIKITAESVQHGDFVQLKIRDLGYGMDAETLRKATQPFFSAKAAGRKRGMGLAYTARFLQINAGTLDIESEPGVGTTVTICLPVK